MFKNNKLLLAIAGISVMIFLIQTSCAMTYSIQPPKMILRGTTGSITTHINVSNPNNQSVYVHPVPMGDIIGIVKFEEQNITLGPNETKRVKIVFDVEYPGNYTGEIIFVFNGIDVL